jgi:hypothetical protein
MKILTTIVAALLSAAAMAQVPSPPPIDDPIDSPKATFESLDRNQDQRVSKVEAAADDGLSAQFAALDADADGYINKNEYMRVRQPRMPRPEPQPPIPDPES